DGVERYRHDAGAARRRPSRPVRLVAVDLLPEPPWRRAGAPHGVGRPPRRGTRARPAADQPAGRGGDRGRLRLAHLRPGARRASCVCRPTGFARFGLAVRFGRLADRAGPRLYLTVAPVVMAAGLLLLTVVTSTNPLVALPGVLVFAVGLACLVAPITSTALK